MLRFINSNTVRVFCLGAGIATVVWNLIWGHVSFQINEDWQQIVSDTESEHNSLITYYRGRVHDLTEELCHRIMNGNSEG